MSLTLKQIFNIDKTVLYYKYMLQNRHTTATEKSTSGFKEAIQRITVLAYANAAGICKLKLAVLGKSQKSCACRGGREVKVLPVYY